MKHSAININRVFLENTEQWDESSILNRSKDLFEVALKIWPSPDEKIQEASKYIIVSSMEEIEEETREAETGIIRNSGVARSRLPKLAKAGLKSTRFH